MLKAKRRKAKGAYSSVRNPHHRDTGRHFPEGLTQHYLHTQHKLVHPTLTLAKQAGT